jgi:hypothetical protein
MLPIDRMPTVASGSAIVLDRYSEIRRVPGVRSASEVRGLGCNKLEGLLPEPRFKIADPQGCMCVAGRRCSDGCRPDVGIARLFDEIRGSWLVLMFSWLWAAASWPHISTSDRVQDSERSRVCVGGSKAMSVCGPDLGIARFVDEIAAILVAGVVIIKPQHCRLAPTFAIAISLKHDGGGVLASRLLGGTFVKGYCWEYWYSSCAQVCVQLYCRSYFNVLML